MTPRAGSSDIALQMLRQYNQNGPAGTRGAVRG